VRRRLAWALALSVTLALAAIAVVGGARRWAAPRHRAGDVLDSLDGVTVHYNGGIRDQWGRSTAPDGYPLGVRYQCVEFVKRYYHQHLGHAMPGPWGDAVDFFEPGLPDGGWNRRRGLLQLTNPSRTPPEHGDLLVFAGHPGNPHGHVAIVSRVEAGRVELVQQNAGVHGASRAVLPLVRGPAGYRIANARVLGWLRVRR
jgi:hypothetical protein